jgi:RNA-directed DNA polymerase
LGIPTVRDRIGQAAIVNVIEPIFERDFAEHNYGFRPGRGCQAALREVDRLLKVGEVHVVDVDLMGCLDSIPHDELVTRLKTKISDGTLLSLIREFLEAGIQERSSLWTPTSEAPQGAVLSPLLSNIYLDPLDYLVAQSGFAMVRDTDDFVILCRTAVDAETALELMGNWVSHNSPTHHPTKTRIVDSRTESFAFLRFEFRDHKQWPRKKSIRKLKMAIRSKTGRSHGNSLKYILVGVNSRAHRLVSILPAR